MPVCGSAKCPRASKTTFQSTAHAGLICDEVRQERLGEILVERSAELAVGRCAIFGRAAYMICRALAGSVPLALAFM